MQENQLHDLGDHTVSVFGISGSIIELHMDG